MTKQDKDQRRRLLRLLMLVAVLVAEVGGAWADSYDATTVKMTYVDFNNPTTSYGEIASGSTARAGYNAVGDDGTVGFGNTSWGCNWITYIQIDASGLPADCEIASATLSLDVSGSTDSNRTTAWGVGYNTSTWSSTMTYNNADRVITPLGDLQWTATKSSSTFETKEFDIKAALADDADRVVTIVVYETAAAGGYVKNPTVSITYNPLYNYTVKSSLGTTIQSGTAYKTSSVFYNYPEFELSGNTLYQAAKQSSNPWYGISFTLSSDNQEETVTYSSHASDVVYYSEAEKIAGGTTYSSSNADIRCSDGKGAAFTANTRLTTLPAGAYKIWGQVWGNSGITFSISAPQSGGRNNVWACGTTGSLTGHESLVFQTETGDFIINSAGNKSHVLDNIYVQALLAFKAITRDPVTKEATPKPDIFPSDRTGITYEIRSLGGTGGGLATKIATVASDGTVTTLHRGTVVLRAKKNIDEKEYYTDHIIPITGGADASSTWTTEGDKETFTLTGNGDMSETMTSPTGRITIAFGNPNETQIVEVEETLNGLYSIDNNGYSHTYYPNGIPTMGTYYTFTTAGESGTLGVSVLASEATNVRLVDADGNTLETKAIAASAWTDLTFNAYLAKNSTYYVYAESGTLYLNSFSFEKKDVVVISLIDQSLLFTPNNNANNNRLDRKIPGFNITFGGGDGAKYEGKGTFIFRNRAASTDNQNGSITITPRIKTGDASDVTITSVTLNTGAEVVGTPHVKINGTQQSDAITANSTQTFNGLTGKTLTIQLAETGIIDAYSFLLNSLTIVYRLDNGTTLDNYPVADQVELKFAKDYIYGYEGETADCDIYFDKPTAFYGDVNFTYSNDTFGNGCTNAVTKHKNSDEKVHLNDGDTNNPYKVRIGQGVSTLTASFAGTDYFTSASATTRLYSCDYVETDVVLAAGGTYTVPAASGVSFAVTTSGGTISLAGTAATPSEALAEDVEFSTTASGSEVTITNTGSSAIILKTISVSRRSGELNFSYNGAVGAGSDVLFTSWNYTPNAFSISGESGIASLYETTGTYTITQPVYGVSINSSTGALTVGPEADNGILKVTLTVNPLEANRALYAPLTKTITLKVVDGMWDFRNYTAADNASMTSSTGWSSGAYNVNSNFADFTDVLRNASNDNTPLPLTLALQVKGKTRLLHSNHGFLHLQGRGVGVNESPYGGGQLRIPAKAGMLVELNCYANDDVSEMEIDNVTDLEGNDITTFYVSARDTESQYFLAKSDGYIVVRNPSVNLDLHIRYIRVSADMAFEYGNETYIDASVGTWSNPVMNQGTTTIAYERTDGGTGTYTVDSGTGVVTIESGQYGTFTIKATGSGTGVLAGKSNSYTVNVVGLGVTNGSHTISAGGTFNLKDNITTFMNTSGADDTGLKDLVVFSLVEESPTVLLNGSTLTIEGVQRVALKATLGAIELPFYCEVTGGTLTGGLNPVIANDATSYTITLSGSDIGLATGKTTYFDVEKMKAGALGEVKSIVDNSTVTFTEDTGAKTLTISGLGGKGGVIPIYVNYRYNSTTDYTIEGTLTVAYTKHTWDFTSNLIGTYGNLRDWTTDYSSSTAAWNSTYATIDEPVDAETNHSDTHDWRFRRKIPGKTDGAIVYYYNHSVEGQNALVIPETEGLHVFASPSNQQLGVEMMQDGGVATVPYEAKNLMLLRGGKVTIPKLKKGQWVELRWTRHKEEMGERILMTNLSDAAGTPITSTYKIGNTFYNLPWSTSTYMFQATNDGDVTFEVADNIYVSIQEIILHEPGWTFQSNFADKLRGYDDISYDKTITDDNNALYQKKYKDYTDVEKSSWTGATAPQIDWQYIWDDQGSHTITFLSKEYQNAPNAPQTWKFEMDEMLTRSGAVMTTSSTDGGEATLTYNGGWGKVKVTMTSYSQNMKYVANQKSWTITFGQAPKRTYPYTWDFTKFFTDTPSAMLNDKTWAAVDYSGSSNPLRVAIYNNNTTTNYGGTANGGWSNTYDMADYQSYYVEGAQLVCYGLRGTNNGVIRETAGLGFKLDTSGDGKPEENMLMLNMTNTVPEARAATNGQTWNTITAEGHQTESHLTIATGGKVIVPKPNDAVNYGNYYIYIRSSHEPSAYNNVKKMVESSPEAKEELDVNYDVPTGVYKYRFSANENAEFTFTTTDEAVDSKLQSYAVPATPEGRKYTDIYAIAVTKDFKTLKKLSGTGWATESRDYAVDYTLNSLLTNRCPILAYSVIARSTNPLYTEEKTKTTVRLQDRNYVVPARQGLVLKQTEGVPNESTYSVPLFVPAVTTAVEPTYAYTNNLMRPNLTGEAPGTTNAPQTFTSETETIDGVEYTRFILSEKYLTWKKDGETGTVTANENFSQGAVPGFFRLHVFGNTSYDSGTDRNTLGANKAYLVLRSDRINSAIWESAVPAPQYVGIAGISDMDEEQSAVGTILDDNRTYNMRGQVVDGDGPLPKGVYIRNGRKFVVK